MAQRIVISRFAVVQKNEHEERARLRVARIARGLLDEPDAAFAAATEAGKMRHQPHGRGEGRDAIPIQTDYQASVFALRIELQHALMLAQVQTMPPADSMSTTT